MTQRRFAITIGCTDDGDDEDCDDCMIIIIIFFLTIGRTPVDMECKSRRGQRRTFALLCKTADWQRWQSGALADSLPHDEQHDDESSAQ